MVANIFKTIEYFITQRVPEIKYVSLYNNQFNNPESNRQIPLPAVLIEILPINFNDLLQNVQYAEVNVNIHLGTEIYSSFDRNDKMQDNSFNNLRMLDKLYISLNRINTSDLPPELKDELFYNAQLKRVGLQLTTTSSIIHTSIISTRFILFDTSAVQYYSEVELQDIQQSVVYDTNL